MSELIAEARVLIRPDTTKFRELLVAEVNTATAAAQKAVKPIVVPVATTAATAGTTTQAAAAAQRELAATTAATAAATETETAAMSSNTAATVRNAEAVNGATAARARSAAVSAAESRALGQATRGVAATAASFAGLRGATLAASGPFLAATVAAVAFAKSLGTFASFQSQLNVFRVTAGATADEMQRVSEVARQLGKDITLPGVSAVDAAEAITELGKAGLSVEDSLSGARGVLQLATAAQLSNAEATKITAGALNAFALSGEEAVRVADLLANAANQSQGSINDMGIALSQAEAVAKLVGLSIEDTVLFLTELSKAGIQGSDAGTSLRVSLIRLINPTAKAREVLDRLNVTLRDAQGNLRSDVFRQFADAQKDLSKSQQQANAAIVFGTDGLRAYSIISQQSAANTAALADSLGTVGTAAEVAGARTSGLAGAASNLENQISNIALSVGGSLAPSVTGLTTALADAVQQTGKLVGDLVNLRAQALKPLDILVNLVPAGGGGGKGGVLDDLKVLATGTIFQVVKVGTDNLAAMQKEAREANAAIAELATQQALPQLIANLNKTGGAATEFDKVIRKLQDMEKQLEGGDAQTEAFRKRLEDFIGVLQTLSQQPDIDIPIKIPEELLTGNVGTEAGTATARKFGASFLPTLEQALKAGTQQALSGGIDPGVDAFLASMRAKVASTFLAIGRAASEVTDVEFRGGSDAQRRAALVREKAAEDAHVAALIEKGASRARIDAAKQAAIATQRQIDAIDEAAAAAAEQKANQRQQAAQKAATARQQQQQQFEQSFLAQQARSRQQAQNRITAAEQTPGVGDDLLRQQQNLALINQQIVALKNSKLSEKAKQAAIDALITARIQTTSAINTLKRTDAEQNRAIREQQQDLNQQIQAQIVGLTATDKDDEAFFRAQIKRFQRQAVALGKATVAGKQATSKALGFVEQLKQLLLARADAQKETEKGQQGTSVLDLLRENAQTFNSAAGNLVTGDQPFTSPGQFSSSLDRFLVRGQTPQIEVVAKKEPGADAATQAVDRTIQNLIEALTQNTAALTGTVTPGKGKPGQVTAPFGTLGAYAPARQARAREEANTP